ncbi:hypothetical protein BC628DRAFT_1110195 [Trametes gibbosa]|nr:hypothetical protein BC628DRAFT_1110195 [Trametes gibbosa]
MVRSPDAHDGDKVKVWCKKCFERRVAFELRSDALRGTPNRTTQEVELWFWAQSKTVEHSQRWIRAHTPDMLIHIRNCSFQSDTDRELARERHEELTLSPRRRQCELRRAHPPAQSGDPPNAFAAATAAAAAAAAATMSTLAPPPITASFAPSTPLQAVPVLSPLVLPGMSNTTQGGTGTPTTTSPISRLALSVSHSPSISPGPSSSVSAGLFGLRCDSPVDLGSPGPSKRARVGRSISRHSSLVLPHSTPSWDPSRQANFES